MQNLLAGRVQESDTLQASYITQSAAQHLSGIEPVNLEVNVELPEGLFKDFSQSDVTIDMEYDPATGGIFNSAAVTLEDKVLESSFNGKGEQIA